MYLFPLGKRIFAIRTVSSGISGNFWGCRDIAFLLLFSLFLFTSYCPSPQYPSFSLSLSMPLANGVNKKNGSTKTGVDQINDLMKIQIKLQRRCVVMLRFLALIGRAHAFDYASGNAHRLRAQALVTDLFDQMFNHLLPAWGRDQAQGNQAFIHDADGLSKTDLSGGNLNQ